jgi:hypothetical protein
MSWWRVAWDHATYRQQLSAYPRDRVVPNFAGRSMSTEFGPTLYARYPGLIDALGEVAVHWSPTELRTFLATRGSYVEPEYRLADAA